MHGFPASKKQLLTTRPAAQAGPFAAELAGIGVVAINQPIITVKAARWSASDSIGAALVFTSANGVVHFAGQGGSLSGRVLFSVGPDTTAQLLEMGAERVLTAEGNADSLIVLIRQNWQPWFGPVVHVGSTVLSVDVAAELRGLGYKARRLTVYDASPVGDFSPSVCKMLAGNAFDGVVLMSRRTAEFFSRSVTSQGLTQPIRRIRLFCLSPNVAQAVSSASDRLVVASSPTRCGMIEAIKTTFRRDYEAGPIPLDCNK